MWEFESRRRLLDLSVGFVEDLRRAGVRPEKSPECLCPAFQVSFPYRGLFVQHVDGHEVVCDANQVVVCTRGEVFRLSGPVADGYSVMIITPTLDVLSAIMQRDERAIGNHPLFRRRAWRADARLLNDRTRLLHRAPRAQEMDVLEAEESVLGLLRTALHDRHPRRRSHGRSTARLIRRTKEFLEAELPNRVRLVDVARAAGASPTYLTDVFRRVEGVPLHRYLTHLRLARALVDLPHTNDLTGLALGLGFSSHSHFSFAFRRAFGATPSQFREEARRVRVRRAAAMRR